MAEIVDMRFVSERLKEYIFTRVLGDLIFSRPDINPVPLFVPEVLRRESILTFPELHQF